MVKPIIGVTPLYDDDRDSIWMLPAYLDAITMAGGVPIMFPFNTEPDDIHQVYQVCDGFLLTGGHDVHPIRYGEEASPQCGISNKAKDLLESRIFQKAYEEDRPVLGICRGLHMMNVELGGTLYQDLPSQFKGNPTISHYMKSPYNRPFHQVQIKNPSQLHDLLGTESFGVNSYHHQGIKRLGQDLEVMAVSEDGLIEAISCISKEFIWGLQWHPEYLFLVDPNSQKIFKEFIRKTIVDIQLREKDGRSAS